MMRFPLRNICRHNRLLVLGVLIGTSLAALPAWSGTGTAVSVPKLTASLETATARVGDLLWLELGYELPEGTTLSGDVPVGGIEGVTVVEQIRRPGTIRVRFVVDRLESFDLGPFTLKWIDGDGTEGTIQADPIAVEVASNLGKKPEEATLRPIKDIMPVESRWPLYLMAVLVVIVLIGIVAALAWWSRKRRAGIAKAAMEDPPHVRAEKEIDRLLAAGLFEKGEVKTFYFSFSETVRRYMEAIRHFPAAEMTTEEIRRHMGANADDQEVLRLLGQADLVKFA
ncbi:MAG: hypothetical protein JXI32_07610, partial [Deltaproteobacteria bacterium]|nr:hypothetical protein [Deltaproteobacteria bacterium]